MREFQKKLLEEEEMVIPTVLYKQAVILPH